MVCATQTVPARMERVVLVVDVVWCGVVREHSVGKTNWTDRLLNSSILRLGFKLLFVICSNY